MRLVLLTALTMVAFAANSVLTRVALIGELIDPSAFIVIRLASGTIMLGVLVLAKEHRLTDLREVSTLSVAGLAFYVLGFSYAYVWLDTGIGALILFGGVQVTMFAGALISGERPSTQRWLGAAVAFAGLVLLMAPSAQAPNPFGAGLMAAAALGWGYYSLYGRGVQRPLQATAGNFLLALPAAFFIVLLVGFSSAPSLLGIVLAVKSGAVTSGLGYALWYHVLTRIDASQAAIAQLTVPVLAMVAGVITLGETLTLQAIIASTLILGGVAISIRR